jgi:glycosyltransferase involved in cell wall biosynthesis
LQTESNIPVVLSAGRLSEEKDFPTLLKAFVLAQKTRPLRLVILGEGTARVWIQDFVKKHRLENIISLPGYKENPFSYMAHASVLVVSSKAEGMPMVLIEAMACGCPVVSTDCPSGPREILENGKFGRLVPVGDSRALAQALLQTIRNPLPKQLLIKEAENYCVERSVEAYYNLVSEILDEPVV